jgi:hypothetical protein
MATLAKYDCKCSQCNAAIKAGDAIKFIEIKKSISGGMCANSRQVGTGKYRVTCAICFADERIAKLESMIKNTKEMLSWDNVPEWMKERDRESLNQYYFDLGYIHMTIRGLWD